MTSRSARTRASASPFSGCEPHRVCGPPRAAQSVGPFGAAPPCHHATCATHQLRDPWPFARACSQVLPDVCGYVHAPGRRGAATEGAVCVRAAASARLRWRLAPCVAPPGRGALPRESDESDHTRQLRRRIVAPHPRRALIPACAARSGAYSLSANFIATNILVLPSQLLMASVHVTVFYWCAAARVGARERAGSAGRSVVACGHTADCATWRHAPHPPPSSQVGRYR